MKKQMHDTCTEHVDVLIVGAGLSGVAAAHYLSRQCQDHRFVVLDAQEDFGGTWWTHQYPGARSDSDLYTYGYAFKPWMGAPIATREEIRAYMGEVIQDSGLRPHIRYGHTIRSASWSTQTKRWTLEVTRSKDNSTLRISTNFLWMCQGYYNHDQGYTPQWPNMEAFKGQIVHPQAWPKDLDCKDKRVVVIGSGATAATVVPALADQGSDVTMLQRSPTYFTIGRNAVPLADELRQLNVDEHWVHEIVRRKLLRDRDIATTRAREEADVVKQELLAGVRAQLGEGFDVDTHFNPPYRPWTQRIAFDPEGGLFRSIREGKASVVTDEIERFVDKGIELKSGKVLECDVVVTATGFNLSVMGDIQFSIDGKPLNFADTVAYRGMVFTGVPNLAWIFGYHRASWTLRVDLVCEFVCRLLRHMQQTGATCVMPALRPQDKSMRLRPWIDPADFSPGYLARGVHLLPQQGTHPGWHITADYLQEKQEFADIDLDDPVFSYLREEVDTLAAA